MQRYVSSIGDILTYSGAIFNLFWSSGGVGNFATNSVKSTHLLPPFVCWLETRVRELLNTFLSFSPTTADNSISYFFPRFLRFPVYVRKSSGFFFCACALKQKRTGWRESCLYSFVSFCFLKFPVLCHNLILFILI